jgi:glycosyltransferase involved in cell wall biosynthesis
MTPRVSILLPTYNRARFLPEAFASIRGQTLADWELIIVDDGSTDETGAEVDALRRSVDQPVICVRQDNAGPYAARNRALDLATGTCVAFYDSDDIWLPQHLSNAVRALDAAPSVDWVYAACRIVDYGSGEVITSDTFRVNGRPRPFRRLRSSRTDGMHVFDDPRTVEWALRYGLYCGLQNSVVRRSVFDAVRFQTSYRNEAEDQLFLIRALKRGHRLGYLDDVHVQYQVHDANSSASAIGQNAEHRLRVHQPVARGFEDLMSEFDWSPGERRALLKRIQREHFWHIGYAILWQNGRRVEALDAFRRGLRFWPWSPPAWKTYLLARLRLGLR